MALPKAATLQEFFSDKNVWCKGSYFENLYGSRTENINQAKRCCLKAAINWVYVNLNDRYNIENAIREIIVVPPEHWNDEPMRTIEDIRELVKRVEENVHQN